MFTKSHPLAAWNYAQQMVNGEIVAGKLAIPGVMTGADRVLLEVTANHLADYRKDPSGYPTTRLNQFILCLARFGMSPSDRTKLGVAKQKDDDPYSHLDD